MKSKRTQADRTTATRAALIAAARPLFTERGFADVSTDEIARAAGVTRGALYHQFDGKIELLAAVFETIEAELTERIAARLAAASDPVDALRDGIDAWLEATGEPEVHRIVLIEVPAALGWERWREIGMRYGGGLVGAAVSALIEAGRLPPQPVLPLTHILLGAIEEAALYAVRAPDREQATEEVRTALSAVLDGLLIGPR